ncbi:hypothetical protein V5O48_016075 [Marasmius crinis-equi]|uniref:Uncharacterized protein n=1 Tax=Marasmius crinis-equi TaxID=585013 RepID=A0ABR3ESQ5_9AGAR
MNDVPAANTKGRRFLCVIFTFHVTAIRRYATENVLERGSSAVHAESVGMDFPEGTVERWLEYQDGGELVGMRWNCRLSERVGTHWNG